MRSRLRPSPAMVVALLALLVALGGTAAAAFGPFKGDKIIEKHSLSGSRLKNGTITGKQVNLHRLGKVPTAAQADIATSAATASNANALGSVAAAGYEKRAMWALVSAAGSIIVQSGGISVETHPFTGGYYLAFPARAEGKAISITPNEFQERSVGVVAGPCGGPASGADAVQCIHGSNTANDVYVAVFQGSTYTDQPFYIVVTP